MARSILRLIGDDEDNRPTDTRGSVLILDEAHAGKNAYTVNYRVIEILADLAQGAFCGIGRHDVCHLDEKLPAGNTIPRPGTVLYKPVLRSKTLPLLS